MAINPDLFEIDVENLDEEWMMQPKVFLKYSLKSVDARETFERAKAKLDVVKAELDLMIRRDPATFDLEKITESAITNTILLQPEYKEAQEEVHAAQHAYNVLQATVQALDHRKRALENLVDLHGMQYFAEPQAGKAGRSAVDDITKLKTRRRGQE